MNQKLFHKVLMFLMTRICFNWLQLLDVDPQEFAEEDGANMDLDSLRKGKCAVIKTSTRQTYFLPVIGLVDPEKLKPGDLVVSSTFLIDLISFKCISPCIDTCLYYVYIRALIKIPISFWKLFLKSKHSFFRFLLLVLIISNRPGL